jgi:1,4-alpha-glucan branching enzyme
MPGEKMGSELRAFLAGENCRAYQFFGAHPAKGENSCVFRVWAPHARSVSVAGDFNDWNRSKNPMRSIDGSGVWECAMEGVDRFAAYKYSVERPDGRIVLKSDPYATHYETPPANASKYLPPAPFKWSDKRWMDKRGKANHFREAMNIYELHLGSWRRYEDGNYFDYVKAAEELAPYITDMG